MSKASQRFPAARRMRKDLRQTRKCLKSAATSDAAVHRARRHIKKARALLLILHPMLGRQAYRKCNRLLHRVTAALGLARDGRILIDRLTELVHHRPSHDRRAAQLLNLKLRRELQHVRKRCLEDPRQARRFTRALRRVHAITKSLPAKLRQRQLRQGLDASYAKARRALRKAGHRPSTETLHRLRKRTKALALQLHFVEKTRSSGHSTSSPFHDLADLLGEEHDFALLGARVACECDATRRPEDRIQLGSLVQKRRTRLQKRALVAASALYAKGKADFHGLF